VNIFFLINKHTSKGRVTKEEGQRKGEKQNKPNIYIVLFVVEYFWGNENEKINL